MPFSFPSSLIWKREKREKRSAFFDVVCLLFDKKKSGELLLHLPFLKDCSSSFSCDPSFSKKERAEQNFVFSTRGHNTDCRTQQQPPPSFLFPSALTARICGKREWVSVRSLASLLSPSPPPPPKKKESSFSLQAGNS